MTFGELKKTLKERGHWAPLLVLVVAIILMGASVIVWQHNLSADAPSNSPLAGGGHTDLPHPVFSIENIDEIRQVEHVAETMPRPDHVDGPFIRTIILPHHTLVAQQIGGFWSSIAAVEKPSVIVVIGPAHGNQGKNLVQTTSGTWHTPVGDVQADDGLVSQLVASGVADVEPDSFVNEHSIGTHVSYIAKLFPGTNILPIIAQSPANEIQARQLVQTLNKILPERALIVASVDFSHYLPVSQSDVRDAATQTMIATRNFPAIDKAGSQFFDSPFSVEAVLMENDLTGCSEHLIWHDNIDNILNRPAQGGTSYLVYTCKDLPPLTLNAVGDIMVARNVGKFFASLSLPLSEGDLPAGQAGTQQPEGVLADATKALSGADLNFANLESVLSKRPFNCEDGICFEADPARVDVLKALGMSNLSVANNHYHDYGELAWQDSVDTLKENNIIPIGDYNNTDPTVYQTVNGRKIAWLAFTATQGIDIPTVVDAIKQAKANQPDTIIVSFHWGVEYHHDHSDFQTELGHAAIDAGADIILGSHPHVLEGVETYNHGLILYSLGNFIFDQIGVDQNQSAIATIGLDGSKHTLTLHPMSIVHMIPRPASPADSATILEEIAKASSPDLKSSIEAGKLEW